MLPLFLCYCGMLFWQCGVLPLFYIKIWSAPSLLCYCGMPIWQCGVLPLFFMTMWNAPYHFMLLWNAYMAMWSVPPLLYDNVECLYYNVEGSLHLRWPCGLLTPLYMTLWSAHSLLYDTVECDLPFICHCVVRTLFYDHDTVEFLNSLIWLFYVFDTVKGSLNLIWHCMRSLHTTPWRVAHSLMSLGGAYNFYYYLTLQNAYIFDYIWLYGMLTLSKSVECSHSFNYSGECSLSSLSLGSAQIWFSWLWWILTPFHIWLWEELHSFI